MRKYYENYRKDCSPSTIHKTYHTSIGALTKMIASCNGNIGNPKRIEKNDDVQKTFSQLQLWAKEKNKKIF